MSDDSSDLAYLADSADSAASSSTLYQKAKSSALSGLEAAGSVGAATALASAGLSAASAAGAVALGASLGSVVPVVGTVVGAVVGTLVALFEFFKRNPNPGIDDAYWDTLGDEGTKTHEPNGLDISTAQLALVTRFAQSIAAQPNWRAYWPNYWWNIAHSANPHSSLLADAVARFLDAPQSTNLPNGTRIVRADGSSFTVDNARGAPPFPPTQSKGSTVNALPIPVFTAPSALQAVPINPKTGLPYPNTGSTATAAAPSGPNMTGVGFTTAGSTLGGGMGSISSAQILAMTANQIALLKAAVTAASQGMMIPGVTQNLPGQAPSISLAQLQSGKPIPIPAHVIVAAASAGNSAAQNTVLNAVSAARSPTATAQQTMLADTLTLAHMIQTHAKYVQKWFGTAAGQAILAGHYLTTANLG